MTDRVIRIVVDASGVRRGARSATGELERVNKKTKQVGRSSQLLKGLLIGVFSAASIRQIGRTADAYNQVQNRLRLVTSGTAELTRVSDELFAASQRTRSSFESTAELFARVSRSTKQLGLSQQEVLDFSETVSQAIQVSGATAQEASAGIVQFSQGLSSGALRGDELRSVLEQLPRLAQALAKGLGTGIGGLRELGEAGELTTEKVFGALQKVAPELASEFAQLKPTIASTFTVLQNTSIQAVGTLDDLLGISDKVTKSILDLSTGVGDSSDELIDFARTLAQVIDIGTIVARVIGGLGSAFGFVGKAIGGLLAGAFDEVADDARALKDSLVLTFADGAEAIAGGGKFATALEDNIVNMALLKKEAEGIDLTQITGSKVVKPIDPKVLEKQKEFIDGLVLTRRELELEAEFGDKAAAQIDLLRVATEAATLGNAAFVEQARLAQVAINAQRIETEALEDLRDNRADDSEVIADLETELRLVALTNEEYEVQRNLLELSSDATAEQRAQVEALTRELTASAEAAELRARSIEDISTVLAEGVGDAILNFEDLPSVIEAVEQQLIQVITQLLIIDPLIKNLTTGLQGVSSGGAGGLSSIGANLLGFLPGFNDGADFKVGGRGGIDNNVVAFRASADERVTVTPAGQAPGGSTANITFNISTPDAGSFKRSQPQILASTQAALSRANGRNN